MCQKGKEAIFYYCAILKTWDSYFDYQADQEESLITANSQKENSYEQDDDTDFKEQELPIEENLPDRQISNQNDTPDEDSETRYCDSDGQN